LLLRRWYSIDVISSVYYITTAGFCETQNEKERLIVENGKSSSVSETNSKSFQLLGKYGNK